MTKDETPEEVLLEASERLGYRMHARKAVQDILSVHGDLTAFKVIKSHRVLYVMSYKGTPERHAELAPVATFPMTPACELAAKALCTLLNLELWLLRGEDGQR